MSDDNLKKDSAGNPIEEAADKLAKETDSDTPQAKKDEVPDVSLSMNKKDAEEFTPVPEKDPKAMENKPGDEVKVEADGKATPTEETVKKALANQQPGGETAQALADEEKRDAEAAAEGKKEDPIVSSAAVQEPEAKPERPARAPISDEEREAKLKRAAEARAARAAAKGEGGEAASPEAAAPAAGARAAGAAAAGAGAARRPRAEAAEEAKPKEPSPKQPQLDRAAAIIREAAGEEAVLEAVVNEKGEHIPTLTIDGDRWLAAAETIKSHPELSMNFLRNLSGVDQEKHLEVVYHFINMTTKQELCVKVKTDRDNPSIPSLTPLYATANWNEREVYDLLGVNFPGHPDLRRIMMSDDWVGHPLRKDYEAFDPEV